MEGFLMKKGAGESTFGRKTWKKRWFVLESYEMVYYEGFDNKSGKPMNFKGSYNIKDCKVELLKTSNSKLCFNIISADKKVYNLQALDENTLRMWMKALEAGSTGNFGRVVVNYAPYYEMLRLNMDEPLTTSAVNKAYRKLALKMHPDKGGDILEFKKLQEASDALLNKIEDEEKEMLYETKYIDACIIKGPPGTGFGLGVVEDLKLGGVSVKTVMPSIQIVKIGPGPNDDIRPGDHLVQVGADDISNWAMNRIVQRLGDFRVPVGSEVQLRFSRRVRIDGKEDEGPITFEEPPKEETVYQPMYSELDQHDDNQVQEESYSNSDDVDEDDNDEGMGNLSLVDDHNSDGDELPVPPQDFFQKTNDIYRQAEEETASRATAQSLISQTTTATLPKERRRSSSYLRYENISDPVLKASMLSEMDEMKEQLEDTKKLLQFANEERSTYAHNVNDLKSEADSLRFQNELLKKSLAESRSREKYLELQLQQALMQNSTSNDQVMQSMRDMVKISNALQSGKQLSPPTQEVQDCMLSMQIPLDDVENDRKMNATRLAALAVGSMDPSGLLLKKWSLSGSSLVDRLSKLESRLSKINQVEQR